MNKDKFESKFMIAPDGCWLWLEWADKDGYGKVRVGKSKRPAHRVSYELYVGPIPDGLLIDHLCKQKACVNPHHLEPVTIAESNRRKPTVTFCEHGIPITTCSNGCSRIRHREYEYRYDIKSGRRKAGDA